MFAAGLEGRAAHPPFWGKEKKESHRATRDGRIRTARSGYAPVIVTREGRDPRRQAWGSATSGSPAP